MYALVSYAVYNPNPMSHGMSRQHTTGSNLPLAAVLAILNS